MPKLLENIVIPRYDFSEFEEIYHKSVKESLFVNRILPTLPKEVVTIFNLIPYSHLRDEYENILIDVKLRKVSEGRCTCTLSGWHYDFVRDFYANSKHEHHYIYTSEDGTEFLLDSDCDSHYTRISDESSNKLIFKVPDNTIATYRRELHRGVSAKRDVTRLLIRVSGVNFVNK